MRDVRASIILACLVPSVSFGQLRQPALAYASIAHAPLCHIENDMRKGLVSLATPGRDYLLGEPILLDVGFKNPTHHEMRMREPIGYGTEPDIAIYISTDGKEFERNVLTGIIAARKPVFHILKPGETISYRLRVLKNVRRPSGLAFERPGEYFVKVHYPTFSADRNQFIPSNMVSVRIKQPTGVDAKIWQRLQEMDRAEKPTNLDARRWELTKQMYGILAEIQFDGGPSLGHARRLLEMLSESPSTGYAEAFRSTLRRFYFSQRPQVSLEERSRIRELTGITDVYEFKDRRLDVPIKPLFDPAKGRVRIDGSIELRLDTLLEALKDQSEVPVEASVYLRPRTIGFAKPPVTLREYMDSEWVTDRLNAWWVKRGDGYVLVREEDLEAPAGKSSR